MGYYTAAIEKKSDDLEHHGILGQKWGVRRYQNPDGTLTPAGVARARKDFSKNYRVSSSKTYGDLVLPKSLLYNEEVKNEDGSTSPRYQTHSLKENGKNVDYTVDKKYGAVVAKSIQKGQEDYWKVVDISDEDVARGKKLLDEISAKQEKQWAKEFDEEMKQINKDMKQINEESEANKRAVDAAKKAGLDQGDNWKVYRDAQAGDKKSQEVVKKWESDKAKYDEYTSAKLREGKNLLNRDANDDTEYSKESAKRDRKIIEKYEGKPVDDEKLKQEYNEWNTDLINKYKKK